MQAEQIASLFAAARDEAARVVVGQDDLIERVLVALFAEGNVLVEGPPGLGKTLLVNTLAMVLTCDFRRVQFTPDLMPSDITGHSVYEASRGAFEFNRGPIFTNLLLADEINRAPAKTQSALLEAMQERQVTVDGQTHQLDLPFITVATQNPIEQEGTYPLPEAQLDRFMMKLLVDYPTVEFEQVILQAYVDGKDARRLDTYELQPQIGREQILEVQRQLGQVIVEPDVLRYITEIVSRTRTWPSVEVGASPRAAVNLMLAARSWAACQGRDFVIPDDVKLLSVDVLRHRLRLQPEAEIEGVTTDQVIGEVLDAVQAPRS